MWAAKWLGVGGISPRIPTLAPSVCLPSLPGSPGAGGFAPPFALILSYTFTYLNPSQ